MIKLVVFPGNPGLKYKATRHNAGFMLLHNLDYLKDIQWQKKYKGEFGEAIIQGKKVFLLKPLTYMNKIGESVQIVAGFYKISAPEILIVHDDLELEFGLVCLKQGGGVAGHNGLRSVRQSLGSSDFFRLRIGIGRPSRGSVSDFVLQRFTKAEEESLSAILDRGSEVIEQAICG